MSLVIDHEPAPFARPRPLDLRTQSARLHADEPLFAGGAVLLALLLVPIAAAGLVDDRLHLGVNIWIKPAKFAVALSVYLVTLAMYARWLPQTVRNSRLYRAFGFLVLFTIAGEMLWIGGAALMGTASHFNVQTALMGAIYGLMGLFAVTLTSATSVYAVAIARNRQTGLAPAAKSGLVWGLGLTLPLTAITAGTMSAMSGHGIGGTGVDTNAVPLIGWLRDGGDLRVAHFFATHAMHFIPLVGLALVAAGRPEAKRVVTAAALVFSVFVLATFVQALAGRPFL